MRKNLDRLAVKAMASLARNIAKDAIEPRSWFFMHQPEAPKNLAKRLQEMEK